MMLGPGSIEWGSKRSPLEKFDYAAGDLALCDRHRGEWVGLMNVPHPIPSSRTQAPRTNFASLDCNWPGWNPSSTASF